MKNSRSQKIKASDNQTPQGAITDVPGIRVGHATNREAQTGCTVILCASEAAPGGAVCGVDVRGAAPGTRETDLLEPGNLVERVHAVLLAGGSAFGLDAAAGVMKFLEERGIGFDTRVARVPIVPAAVIFDLAVGNAHLRPDAAMGYQACVNATDEGVEEGQVGVGSGAMVGKILGIGAAAKGGVATAAMRLASGASVGVLVVVNAFGDIVNPANGDILAGARDPNGRGFLNTERALTAGFEQTGNPANATAAHPFTGVENTTLAVVATDAALTKAQARKVAQMAHDGLARAIRPVHTMFDGDTIFALSTGNLSADLTTLGAAAARLLAAAIARLASQGERQKVKGKR